MVPSIQSENPAKLPFNPNCFFAGVPNVVPIFLMIFSVATVVPAGIGSFHPKREFCGQMSRPSQTQYFASVRIGQMEKDEGGGVAPSVVRTCASQTSLVGGCALAKLSRAGAHAWGVGAQIGRPRFFLFGRQMRKCFRSLPKP